MKSQFLLLLFLGVAAAGLVLGRGKPFEKTATNQNITHPLMISELRKQHFPGSDPKIEQTLPSTPTYDQQIVSYQSQGLKIFALLTLPRGEKPTGGWPVIVFNHGYIPPEEYQTTERYASYVDGFARNGFIVFKPDYRGHGSSEGKPEGAYFSPAYTVDVLNALSSIKKFPQANPNRIGMWGHSLGGHLTLRSMVVSPDIKAGVIWAGVVGSYQDMFERWFPSSRWRPSDRELTSRRVTRDLTIRQYGSPSANPKFWNAISPINFVKSISGPLQLHHGTSDETVPPFFSQNLKEALEIEGKTVELYLYQEGDHNLSGASFGVAMQRSVEFFKKYLN